jgi:hypothetical protein
MRSPKILQLPRRTAALLRTSVVSATRSASGLALLAAGLLALSACSVGRAPDSPARAEKRAVALANDRCEQDFGKRPFRTGRFPATLSGERWLWGWLDAAGGQGFTAQVSFRADGSEPETRIYSIAKEEFDMESPDAPRLGSSPETDALTH